MPSLKPPSESFRFRIPGYGLDHQTGAIVDLLVTLDFKEGVGADDPFAYPEFVSVVNVIKDYLVNYPNETDFWEILNKNLVTTLLRDTIPTSFGVEYHLDELVDSLTVDLAVQPGSSLVNFPRSSTVTGSPDEVAIDFDQSFSFGIPGYGLDHQGGAIVDIQVDLNFKEDIAIDDPFEYPEFVSIVNFVKDYLVNYPNETDFWEILNKNLVTSLLRDTIPTTFGVEYHLDEVVDSLTVDLAVQPGSSLVNFPRSSTVTGSPDEVEIDYDQSFSFGISDYGLDHQGGAIVDIQVDLNFKEDIAIDDPFEYPEFVSVVNFIKDYLVNYPNETDFWEILNKNLVTTLLRDTIPTSFGVEYHLDEVVDSLTVDIQVQPGSSLVNFPRSSTVTGAPQKTGIDFDQSFSFAIPDYGLDHQGGAIVDILVDMDFKEDIAIDDPFEYPEFVSIVNVIKNYLVTYPNETDFWEILNKNLTEALLSETIPTTFGVEYHLDQILDALTVDIQVQPGSSLVNFPRASTVTQPGLPVPAASLRRSGEDVLAIDSASTSKPSLQVILSSAAPDTVLDLAVFKVDDAKGRIDGLAPADPGYEQAALDRARTVFSTLPHSPDRFDLNTATRSLPFNTDERFRFLLIRDDSFDAVRRQLVSSPEILFADAVTRRITDSGARGYGLSWQSDRGEAGMVEDLNITVLATDAALPTGVDLQGRLEGEVISTPDVTTDGLVPARIRIHREDPDQTLVGFYAISDARGTVIDPLSGKALRPGEIGYTAAALQNRLQKAGEDLPDPGPRSRTAMNVDLQAGSVYAPFVVADSSLDRLLDEDTANDPAVFFPYIKANPDRADHMRLLADNTFGFDARPGDSNPGFNDVIAAVNLL